jgi:cytochrome c-type biogenesis protein CcmH/NrfG
MKRRMPYTTFARRMSGTTFVINVVAILSLAAVTAGQSPTPEPANGRVYGTVFDPNRAVVTDARVRIESRALRREVWTSAEGVYSAMLPAGIYSLTVDAQGFCPFRAASVRVEPGGVHPLDFNLRIATVISAIFIEDGRPTGERSLIADAGTGVPCALKPLPPAEAAPHPPVLLASAQRGAAKRPAATNARTTAKQPASGGAAQRTSVRPSTKTAAKPPAKTAAKPSSGTAAAKAPAGVLNLSTQPGAVVWVDEVRRGAADAEGKLQLKLTPGRHSLRVRASGYAERTLPILPTQRGALSVVLTKTTDEAELLFQQAEDAREKGNAAGAIDLYRQALKLRPRYAAAHLGLARALESQENFDAALEELQAARGVRPVYAEASAVEGRIQRSLADPEAALAAYRRALRESNGFQPEAYAGMGIVYEDRGQTEEAVAAFRKAVAQLSDTEPILYELLARNLEKLERWKEAVAAYEKYLELAPTGAHASAINSIIDQLRKQAAESEQQQPPE